MDDLDALFRTGSGKGRKRQRNPEADNPVAKFIREQRTLQGMTQAELADRAGVPLVTLRNIEQGKSTVRMDSLNRILSYFNYEVGPIPVNFRDRA